MRGKNKKHVRHLERQKLFLSLHRKKAIHGHEELLLPSSQNIHGREKLLPESEITIHAHERVLQKSLLHYREVSFAQRLGKYFTSKGHILLQTDVLR